MVLNSRLPSEVSSLGQVVKKFNGSLIDSLLTNNQEKQVTRSQPIDIPKPGRRSSLEEDPLPSYLEVADTEFAIEQIAEQIELAVKRAKTSCLSCLEVLLPLNLTRQVAQDVLSSSETEPCGLRGCVLYINYESEEKETQRIAVIRPTGTNAQVATFELFLTLRQANSGWLSTVSSRVWKQLGRKTIVINESYQLSKRKLFRSDPFHSS